MQDKLYSEWHESASVKRFERKKIVLLIVRTSPDCKIKSDITTKLIDLTRIYLRVGVNRLSDLFVKHWAMIWLFFWWKKLFAYLNDVGRSRIGQVRHRVVRGGVEAGIFFRWKYKWDSSSKVCTSKSKPKPNHQSHF